MKLAVAIGVIVACAALWACGGSPTSAPKHTFTTPLSHRASTPAACTPQPIEPGTCTNAVAGTATCATASDCMSGLDGSCNGVGGVCSCVYDDCLTDSDCAPGTACSCDADRGGAGASGNPTKCVPSNCRVDADCGPGGYCSPSGFAGGPGGCGSYLDGYYCHTPADECGNPSDCPPVPLDVVTCVYSPEVAHWVCGTAALCAG